MMILSLTAGLAACGLAGEGSQAAAKDVGGTALRMASRQLKPRGHRDTDICGKICR